MVALEADDYSTSVDELIEPGVLPGSHVMESHGERAEVEGHLPLAEPVPAAQWGDTWRGVASKWPSVDPSTKDPSRMYYVPAVRQSMPLCRVPKRLAYRRGTYEARLQLGRRLTPPAPPPAPERCARCVHPGGSTIGCCQATGAAGMVRRLLGHGSSGSPRLARVSAIPTCSGPLLTVAGSAWRVWSTGRRSRASCAQRPSSVD